MCPKRYAARRDLVEPTIVNALEAAGVHVWRNLPVDLLTYRQVPCSHCGGNRWKPLEVKDPKAKPDKRQKAQAEFLKLTGVPIVRNADQALAAVGVKAR